jgi:hypothetical protein
MTANGHNRTAAHRTTALTHRPVTGRPVTGRAPATAAAPESDERSGYQRAVEERTGEVLARVLGRPVTPSILDMLTVTADVIRAHRLPARTAAGRQNVVQLASVYLREFAPPAPWRFAGQAGAGAASPLAGLRWTRPDGQILIDVIRGTRFDQPLLDRATSALIAALSAEGTAEHGQRFIGVRVLALAAPRLSRLYGEDGQFHPLPDLAPSHATQQEPA